MRFMTYSKMIRDTDQIFDAFHREDDIRAGFGLGLEIVGSICKKENITIRVESGEVSTVFIYTFPILTKVFKNQ